MTSAASHTLPSSMKQKTQILNVQPSRSITVCSFLPPTRVLYDFTFLSLDFHWDMIYDVSSALFRSFLATSGGGVGISVRYHCPYCFI